MNTGSEFNNFFMRKALDQAKIAYDLNEVPVGCVIVDTKTNSVITESHNIMETKQNPNFHAEIIAINNACSILSSKNLSHCDIYVTLEPCVMCASAIANARIANLYYAASDTKHGAVENGIRFFTTNTCFHRPEIYFGTFEKESESLMKSFFSKIRKNKI